MLSDYSAARFKPENLIFYSRQKKEEKKRKKRERERDPTNSFLTFIVRISILKYELNLISFPPIIPA